MVNLFMMGVGWAEVAVLAIPIAIFVFIKSWKFFGKRFRAGDSRIVLYSIIASLVITPLLFTLLMATIVMGFIMYERMQ